MKQSFSSQLNNNNNSNNNNKKNISNLVNTTNKNKQKDKEKVLDNISKVTDKVGSMTDWGNIKK